MSDIEPTYAPFAAKDDGIHLRLRRRWALKDAMSRAMAYVIITRPIFLIVTIFYGLLTHPITVGAVLFTLFAVPVLIGEIKLMSWLLIIDLGWLAMDDKDDPSPTRAAQVIADRLNVPLTFKGVP